MQTRSSGHVEPAATEKVQVGGGGLARGTKNEAVARGRTRTGKLFTRQSRGNYSSLAELRRAHKKIFSMDPSFCLLGECITVKTKK